MSDFQGMEDLLQDFLIEGGDMLSSVDNKLVDLERAPGDKGLLNDIFRGFHTIKGGAGFLAATEMVSLCHLGENLLDKLRNGELTLTQKMMDVILGATGGVREMFDRLEMNVQPLPADPHLVESLKLAISGSLPTEAGTVAAAHTDNVATESPNWNQLHQAVTGASPPGDAAGAPAATVGPGPAPEPPDGPSEWGRRAADRPSYKGATGRRDGEKSHDNSIRVDTSRLDQVLNLSGEIGLTKNRLTSLRSDILSGRNDTDTLHALDLAVSQLDLLVSDLQNAVMKTRMQPIGRLFQKYPRIARDIARQLGKEIDLTLTGEDTEIDKTMIEDLADPIIHLIRNAVDHGVEMPQERLKNGKPEKATIRLEARQEGDHIVIVVGDDGHGMNADKLRAKALEKGLITAEEANMMDERASFNLIFMPGFSTKDKASDLSGRGVGMDVVKTNITKLNGSVEIRSTAGQGTSIIISLPLTLAILPVLLVELGKQPFAVPLAMVREILPIEDRQVQEVGGRATMVVRGEVLPIYPLSNLLGWPRDHATAYGVLMQSAEQTFILAVQQLCRPRRRRDQVSGRLSSQRRGWSQHLVQR